MTAIKTILELNTGLFPDAGTVVDAIATCEGRDQVIRLDVRSSQPDDTESWEAVAAAILSADLIVTL